eukprot:scaffold269797_cov21-Prasinocladus_malaysianus.AAC.1
MSRKLLRAGPHTSDLRQHAPPQVFYAVGALLGDSQRIGELVPRRKAVLWALDSRTGSAVIHGCKAF